MKKSAIPFIPCVAAFGLVIASSLTVGAQTVIYSDNFNVANTANFDTASLSGRLSGLNASAVVPQSGGYEEAISGNQMLIYGLDGGATGSGLSTEMRFGNASTPSSLFDWSSGAGGAAITAAGGMTVSFNWTAPDTTSGAWLSFCMGTLGDVTGTPTRVNNSSTDNGILFRNNGQTAIFNNGSAAGTALSITPASVNHVIAITYDFTSWATGAPVTMSATEDGTLVGTDSFTWSHGAGSQYLDLQSRDQTAVVDNFTITTVPEPTTLAIVSIGLGLLVVTRRFRGQPV